MAADLRRGQGGVPTRAGRRVPRAGRPEARVLTRRLMDAARASQLGMDRIELRRKTSESARSVSVSDGRQRGRRYGDYQAHSSRAREERCRQYPRAKADSASRGKLRGWACRRPPTSRVLHRASAVARRARRPAPVCTRRRACGSIRTGSVTMSPANPLDGQGHETTFAQIVSREVGLHDRQHRCRYGDTIASVRQGTTLELGGRRRLRRWIKASTR